jgi:hypothetical protein
MPSHSKKQHNFMEAIAHSPSFAKKAGVPQSVGKDYAAADKGKTFSKGGNMKRMAFGGETASDKKAKDRLANMREEDAEVAEGRQKQQKEERLAGYRRGIAMDDLKAAQKQGKTYDKWFEDNRKTDLKKGRMSQEAYDAGKGIEMLSPSQHREALVSGYKKGGEVKEPKSMVGKEVAFFKKKGAPKSMIKHEEAEMKGMKRGGRVRRMAEGGETDMSMGYGDPFAKPRNYEAEKEQGAKSLRGIKNFLEFGDSSDEGERKPTGEQRKTVTPAAAKPSWAGSGDSDSAKKTYPLPRNRTLPDIKNPESDDNERKFRGPQFANSVSDRGEGELSGDGLSPAQGPKAQPKRRPAMAGKPIGVEKTVKQERVITEPVDTSRAAIEERRAAERKTTETKPKSPSRFGLASDETRESVRRGLGRFADIFNLSKRHEQEFGKKAAKGGQVKRMRYGGSPDDGMDMGQPMRGGPMNAGRGVPMAAAPAPMNPNSIAALEAKYGTKGPQGGNPMLRDPRMKTGGSVKKMAEGGFTREADGVAKKGKTQGKVVKMAGGGFVKSADGCAQRGKTKGAQVKMSRGGKC